MSEAGFVVRARGLTKVYRLYAKPQHRFLDMFGLLPARAPYGEHLALDRVDLEIRRGERVAFIGRNGAGKSTLLKIVTGVIRPTSGELEVARGAHALLQIGSSFHADFTGRQNVLAYLAHLGLRREEAARRVAQIVEFAELEEYIDQPIKTYSTGMVARLMFSASTALEPEVLVLDEILGVGDAYFAQKSFERIREMCAARGTTVLLVSHDIYAAARLCDRMVWLDRGKVLFDGRTQDAMRAYESSVREQEESRLRARKLLSAHGAAPAGTAAVMVEATALDAIPEGVAFARLAVELAGGGAVELPVTRPDAFSPGAAGHLVEEGGNWAAEVAQVEGRAARAVKPFGSPFHKVCAVAHVPAGAQVAGVASAYRAPEGALLRLSCYDAAGREIASGEIGPTGGAWRDAVVRGVATATAGPGAPERPIGTNRIRIVDARFVDDAGHETFFLAHGGPVRLLVDYRINDPALAERAQVVVALHRDGAVDVCRFVTRDLAFDGAALPAGRIEFRLARMPVTAGRYALTVLIAEEGYYDRLQTQYFSINPGVYACASKILEFEVAGSSALSSGTVFIGEADWALLGPGATAESEAR
jgi:ABC-type polysaccharide/polyol phosphate transport system ATPase subunit